MVAALARDAIPGGEVHLPAVGAQDQGEGHHRLPPLRGLVPGTLHIRDAAKKGIFF